MIKKIFISVVVPAYNEEKYIESCLRALNDQDYDKNDYEIIVVDNNSIDKTSQIAKKFGAKVILEKKQGYVFALSKGMKEAKGKVIAVTDADTQVSINWLSTVKKSFLNPNIVGITGLAGIDTKSRIKNISAKVLYAIFVNLTAFMNKPNLSGFNFAVRSDAFLKVGGLDNRFEMSPDVDLGLRLARIGEVKVDNSLYVTTSIRRWQRGFMSALWGYTKGYIYAVWFRKPPRVEQKIIR